MLEQARIVTDWAFCNWRDVTRRGHVARHSRRGRGAACARRGRSICHIFLVTIREKWPQGGRGEACARPCCGRGTACGIHGVTSRQSHERVKIRHTRACSRHNEGLARFCALSAGDYTVGMWKWEL